MIKETVDLLGHRATDKVTNATGVITSVCFDLYGCVQAAINPPMKDDGSVPEGRWFDVNRLVVSYEAVMPVPDFDAIAAPGDYNKGPAEKPALGHTPAPLR